MRVLGREELVAPALEQRHVGVHARAVLAEQRLGHEGRVDAVLGRDLLHDQPVRDRAVGHVERVRVAHVDLVLRGTDLVVVVLDRDPDRLERGDRVVTELGRGILRRHREVAALVEGLRAGRVLEEEVLELGPDVEGVEARLLHPLERHTQHVAWIAFVGVAARRHDVADHPPDLALAGLPRHHLEGLRIRDRDHVRLLDRVEAGDRRAVEPHPVVQRLLDLGGRDRKALQVTFEVGEPEQDGLDLLVFDPLQHRPPVGKARGRAVLALDRPRRRSLTRCGCSHVFLPVNEKSPEREIRVRGTVAVKTRLSLPPRARARGRRGAWRGHRGPARA